MWVEFHLAFQIRNMARRCCIMRVVNYAAERASENYLMKEYKRGKKEIETPLGLIALVHLMPQQQRLDAKPFEEHFHVKMECWCYFKCSIIFFGEDLFFFCTLLQILVCVFIKEHNFWFHYADNTHQKCRECHFNIMYIPTSSKEKENYWVCRPCLEAQGEIQERICLLTSRLLICLISWVSCL